jgi:HEPN domain-containing protein
VIREKCDDVEMIILFGSYARGDYKTEADLEPERKSGHVSDYDILVVTGARETVNNAGLWDEITAACNTPELSAHARLIAHDIQALNIKLAEGQYFFSDIKKEGIILFDAGKTTLADKRALTPEEQQRIAQDHFDHWFDRANDFFQSHLDNLKNDRLKISVFELHQATEACYKTVMLVATNYNPNEHWLAALSNLVIEQDGSFEGIFPYTTSEEKDRLMLLDYAYIGARYDPKYRISKRDLETLAISVKKLLELTEEVCVKKINAFAVNK